MLIDITLNVTPEMLKEASELKNPALIGHLGTHFDAMDKQFPLEYTKLDGIVFDVSAVKERDIDINDINLSPVQKNMFIAFFTGFIDEIGYGNNGYFSAHPQLSKELIEALIQKGVSIIGLDFAGVRRGAEHIPTDQYCAEFGTFIIENLVNLNALLEKGGKFTANTYPMNIQGITGLPCRVIAEIQDY
ncbi:MAG: cyclase [Ruminococcaceae bacterium]|nr:cyclase [Oscillospiraceae bacterium]